MCKSKMLIPGALGWMLNWVSPNFINHLQNNITAISRFFTIFVPEIHNKVKDI
jgi:hypothetical protein